MMRMKLFGLVAVAVVVAVQAQIPDQDFGYEVQGGLDPTNSANMIFLHTGSDS